MQIRTATETDSQAILHCLHTAFAPYRWQYSEAGFADTTLTAETIQRRMTEMQVFVATDEKGHVVGTIACCAISAEEGHIRGMAVLPEALGSGVAAQLLERAEQELRQLGCTFASLDTTAPLQRAIRFYEKYGYRASGKVGDFYGMPLYEYVKAL